MIRDRELTLRAGAGWLFLPGAAIATGESDKDGLPVTRNAVRKIRLNGVFAAPKQQARRLLDRGEAAELPLRPDSLLARLLAETGSAGSRVEAALVGRSVPRVAVWRAVMERGVLRLADAGGGLAHTGRGSFRDAATVAEFWEAHPKATPSFTFEQEDVVFSYAWFSDGCLLEIPSFQTTTRT